MATTDRSVFEEALAYMHCVGFDPKVYLGDRFAAALVRLERLIDEKASRVPGAGGSDPMIADPVLSAAEIRAAVEGEARDDR